MVRVGKVVQGEWAAGVHRAAAGVLALVAGVALAATTDPAPRASEFPPHVEDAKALFVDLTKAKSNPPNPDTREDMARALDATLVRPPIPQRHAAAVERAMALGRQLMDGLRRERDEGVPPALRQARETAAAATVPRCEGMGYRPIVLPPEEGGKPVVYLFGWPPPNELLLLGPHHRLEMSADGRSIERTVSSTEICYAVSAQRPMFAHPQACAPTEFDVFLNLLNGRFFFMATEAGNWVIDRGRVSFLSRRARPCFDTRLSRALDRWVLFGRPRTPDAPYHLGHVYMDPRGGISVRYAGDVVLEGEDRFRRVPGVADGVPVTLRPETFNETVAPLAAEVVAALGLEAQPAWSQGLDDGLAPDERDLRAGRFLNRIGDPAAALGPLERWAPQAAGNAALAYELGFAYNALRRYQDAMVLLAEAVDRHPQDTQLCREFAFAEQQTGRLERAAKRYPACIALAGQREPMLRAEMAANLAALMNRLGDAAGCRQWRDQAREWASPDMNVYRLLHDPKHPGAPCTPP